MSGNDFYCVREYCLPLSPEQIVQRFEYLLRRVGGVQDEPNERREEIIKRMRIELLKDLEDEYVCLVNRVRLKMDLNDEMIKPREDWDIKKISRYEEMIRNYKKESDEWSQLIFEKADEIVPCRCTRDCYCNCSCHLPDLECESEKPSSINPEMKSIEVLNTKDVSSGGVGHNQESKATRYISTSSDSPITALPPSPPQREQEQEQERPSLPLPDKEIESRPQHNSSLPPKEMSYVEDSDSTKSAEPFRIERIKLEKEAYYGNDYRRQGIRELPSTHPPPTRNSVWQMNWLFLPLGGFSVNSVARSYGNRNVSSLT
jgi:hypothetical protein